MFWLRRLLLVWFALAWLCACEGSGPGTNPRFPQKQDHSKPKRPALDGPPALPAVIIAELGSADSEVHFARHGGNGLLLTRSQGRWLTGRVHVDRGKDAVPESQPSLVDVAPAPKERAPVALAKYDDGFLLAWAQPRKGGDEVWALPLSFEGEAKGKCRRVAVAPGRVSWVEVVSSELGLVLWEVPSRDGSVLELGSIKAGQQSHERLTERAAGWHAVASGSDTAIAWVEAAEGQGRNAAVGTAKVAAVHDGLLAATTTLSAEGTAMSDIQVAATAGHFLVAWTDTGRGDPHVTLAQLSRSGVLETEAHPALAPVGGQALVALVAAEDGKRALVTWEPESSQDERLIELATLDASGKLLDVRGRLSFGSATDAPHFVPDGSGFATLTLGPLKLGDADGQEPIGAGPIYVRLDAKLRVRAAEPVRVEPLADQGVVPGVPAAVRGLNCQDDLCSALATGEGKPALLVLVTLPVRESPWVAPAERLPAPKPPRATSLDSAAGSPRAIAETSAATLADGRTLLTWVTLHDSDREPGESRGPVPARAQLAFRFIAADGTPGPVKVISERAISVGGVKAVPLPPKRKRDGVAVIAWAGPNANAAQVFLTKIAADGSKLDQRTLTQVRRKQKGQVPNEVYDVDLAVDGRGGLVCSWTDSRDGSAEIFVARANAQLRRVKREQAVSNADGSATGPALTVFGNRIWVAWSQTSVGSAAADIHLVQLDLSSMKPVGTPRRVSESPAHSRTATFAGSELSAATLAWIDETSAQAPGGLRYLALDETATPLGAERRVLLVGGEPVSSATLRCDAERCRGVVAGRVGHGLGLGALDLGRASGPLASRAVRLATIASGTDQDVGLVAGTELGAVFFVEALANGGRVRRLAVDW